MGGDLNKYDSALSRLYRKYWRRSASSPEMEIAVDILGSIGMYHFKKKLVGGGGGMMGGMMGSMLSGLPGGWGGAGGGAPCGTEATGPGGAARGASGTPGAGPSAGRATARHPRVPVDSSDEEEGLPETFL